MITYGYRASPSDTYVLLRDGIAVLRGTESDVWAYVHRTHCYSVSWAIAHEGYRVRTAEEWDSITATDRPTALE